LWYRELNALKQTTDYKLALVVIFWVGVIGVIGIAASASAWGIIGAFIFACLVFGGLGWALYAAYRRSSLTSTRLIQAKTAVQRIAEGYFDSLPDDDEAGQNSLSQAFKLLREAISAKENAVREENLALTLVNIRMSAVLDATDDGLALVGEEGYIILVNRRFCEMIGIRRDNLLLRGIEDIDEELEENFVDTAPLRRALTPRTQEGNASVFEEVVEHAKERTFLQVYSAPIRNDAHEIAGQVIAFHDITREKELDKMKTEFISVVSHELRTPLTSIKGYTDVLASGQAGDINEIQKEFLDILQSSANRLGNLINDILDISRIEAGRMEVKKGPVDYKRIVGDALRLMKPVGDEKNISLDSTVPSEWPVVRGDSDKITQILSNLLSNAIKYTPAGGSVNILVEPSEGSITTSVCDTGIGITVEDQKKLFQKFFRADNSLTREAGGTGLGLVIVKSIVEALGGRIWVESKEGEGSKFIFTLPIFVDSLDPDLQHQQTAAVSGVAQDSSERGLGMILVVEGDPFIRDQAQHSLHRRGFSVVVASEPKEALAKAEANQPDAILLDMLLPGSGGLETIRLLMGSTIAKKTPIVAYSLGGDPARRLFTLSSFSLMKKPLDSAALANKLLERLGSGGRPKALIAVSEPDALSEARNEADALQKLGVDCTVAGSLTEALTKSVMEAVDAVVIDLDSAGADAFMEMMRAMKSEEDAARIPIIMKSDALRASPIHFHLGGENAEIAISMNYLADRLTQALK
jgi:PAS domain S-box-containing protein